MKKLILTLVLFLCSTAYAGTSYQLVTDGSFENLTVGDQLHDDTLSQYTVPFGMWWAEADSYAAATNIIPAFGQFEGVQNLLFRSTDDTRVSVIQYIDLAAYESEIEQGDAWVRLSAWYRSDDYDASPSIIGLYLEEFYCYDTAIDTNADNCFSLTFDVTYFSSSSVEIQMKKIGGTLDLYPWTNRIKVQIENVGSPNMRVDDVRLDLVVNN